MTSRLHPWRQLKSRAIPQHKLPTSQQKRRNAQQRMELMLQLAIVLVVAVFGPLAQVPTKTLTEMEGASSIRRPSSQAPSGRSTRRSMKRLAQTPGNGPRTTSILPKRRASTWVGTDKIFDFVRLDDVLFVKSEIKPQFLPFLLVATLSIS